MGSGCKQSGKYLGRHGRGQAAGPLCMAMRGKPYSIEPFNRGKSPLTNKDTHKPAE